MKENWNFRSLVALATPRVFNSHRCCVASTGRHRTRTFPSSPNSLLGSAFQKGSSGYGAEDWAAKQGWPRREQRGGYWGQMVAAGARANGGRGDSGLTSGRCYRLATSICCHPDSQLPSQFFERHECVMHQPDSAHHCLMTWRNGPRWGWLDGTCI